MASTAVQWIAPWVLGEAHTWMNYRANRERVIRVVSDACESARAAGKEVGFTSDELDAMIKNDPKLLASYGEVWTFRKEFLKQA